MRAFGGTLLGVDAGEWIGALYFQEPGGGIETVLKENVVGLVENEAGVFAFTGLQHLDTNVGDLYTITRSDRNDLVATRLGRLPGLAQQLVKMPDGSTTFLVDTYSKERKHVLECFRLVGRVVQASALCEPPLPRNRT